MICLASIQLWNKFAAEYHKKYRMSTKEIRLKQEDFLYDLPWDAKVDNLFVEVLSNQARLGTFQVHGDNSNVIGTA